MAFKNAPAEKQFSDQPLSSRQLLQKIAAQDRIIAVARANMRRLKMRHDKVNAELQYVKTNMQAIIQRRTRQIHQMNQHLQIQLSSQQQDKEQLQESEVQFRALVESSADHIFMLDENGTYIFSNDRVQQFGLRKGSELIGRRLQDVYSREVCSQYREKLREVITYGKVVSFNHEKQTVESTEYHLDTLYPIQQDRTMLAVGGICRDISEQKKFEKQLFQSQKLEALGTLVAGVAHEINNPINLILFNLPLIQKMWRDFLPLLANQAENEPNRKYGGLTFDFIKENLQRLISDMELAANRVAQIVTGLKDFARKGNPSEKKAIQVNQAVDNAIRLARATLKTSDTVLKLNLASDLPLIHANLQNVEQIVLNLIINALQSIGHEDGKVCIATQWQPADQTISIVISDNGRGINPMVMDKIFDPFVTDRQANGGTGLGLSVTYNLIKAHNGDISFQTKPGQGTEFNVTLPVLEKRRPFKVMVVDDDSAFRDMLIHALSNKTNCITEGFSNGAEALIRLGGVPPDLLILDMFMPEIDGLGVCRAIKNELGIERMKVIIVTGYPNHPNLYEAASLGFTQIFTKPLMIEDFIEVVQGNLNGTSA